ncbi:MAG: hypothetical protein NT069_05685 [Planctomycetota bacterium]|nr:hypothetical protein [Planctomycetota bacterium]
MKKTSWNIGQAALAISLFISVGGASATRAGDVQLVECRSDNGAANRQGYANSGSQGIGGGACDYCRSHGLSGCRHGGRYAYGNGAGMGDGRNGGVGNGAYVNGLFTHAAYLGRGGNAGAGNGSNGTYWCDQCRGWHGRNGHGGHGDCNNGDCDGNGCRDGRCGNGKCLGGKCYRPVEGYYADPRDSEVYSATGYNVPVTVPLPPVVKYQYQYGWGMPSSRLVQVGNTYTQYYPQQFFTQSGGRLPGGPPTVYQQTDTTQSGFYYSHTPRWTPVKRINSINYNYGY